MSRAGLARGKRVRLDSGKGGPGLPVFNMPNSSPQMFYKMTLKVQGVN